MLPALNLTLFVCGCGSHWMCVDWWEVWIRIFIFRENTGKAKQKSVNYVLTGKKNVFLTHS